DGDGLPDAWELANGTAPGSNDANNDPDLDGLTNLQEFWAGTSPTNALSTLRLEAAALPGDNLRLSFSAISNRSYTIESRLSLGAGNWTNLTGISSALSNRSIEITNPSALEA